MIFLGFNGNPSEVSLYNTYIIQSAYWLYLNESNKEIEKFSINKQLLQRLLKLNI